MKLLRTIFIPDNKFYKRVLLLAPPISLQSLITIGVNMLDTIMVGTLGEQELSATSLANQFINIYHIFCMGLGMGASVLVSRYWGMKESEPEKSALALKKTILMFIIYHTLSPFLCILSHILCCFMFYFSIIAYL